MVIMMPQLELATLSLSCFLLFVSVAPVASQVSAAARRFSALHRPAYCAGDSHVGSLLSGWGNSLGVPAQS